VDSLPSIEEADLARLVDAFYARVRMDVELGPIFNDAIQDWPEHLEKLAAFCSSVMLSSGRYKGQPLPAHLKHQGRITPALFDRWLNLWKQTTEELMEPDAALALQAKAARIAESLQLALFFRLDRPAETQTVRTANQPETPARPYRSTPLFDQDTLPAALRARHDTKAGVWGMIRVIEGKLRLTYLDPPSEVTLTPDRPGLILPQQPHFVTPVGAMKMQVDFYDQPPCG